MALDYWVGTAVHLHHHHIVSLDEPLTIRDQAHQPCVVYSYSRERHRPHSRSAARPARDLMVLLQRRTHLVAHSLCHRH
jgi:hypothetical protein